MNHFIQPPTRRSFLASGALAGAGVMLFGSRAWSAEPAGAYRPPVCIFSKVYQSLKLNFEQSAEMTADAGFNGVDCAVRKGGEIEPERASDDLPRYAEALAKHQQSVLLLATGIFNVDSPHARDVLVAAKKLGVTHYRLGFISPKSKVSEIKPQLKELAALNKELGMTGMIENHAKPDFLGGDLNQMLELVGDHDPAQMGVAFDVAHAIIQHGDDWPTHFERLKSHIRVAYIKDVQRPKKFVPFGEGEFNKFDFFKRLRAMNLMAPMSLHIEFDWTAGGKPKTRDTLLAAAKASNKMLHKWLAAA